jgi:hypothetical protein
MVGCKYKISIQYTVTVLTSLQQNAHRYPVLASLARDHLAIMVSSVSSERAFSQGGITISERQSQLKGDIVEVLQLMKCSLLNDLIFPEPSPSSITEIEQTDVYGLYDDVDKDQGAEDGEEEESWDTLLLDDGEDEGIDQDMFFEANETYKILLYPVSCIFCVRCLMTFLGLL